MPENEKFDCKDILLIIITCMLIIAVIAMCVFVSSYAILNQRTNTSDVNTSEACIASESLERELAVNYAIPSSNIVSYEFSNYSYNYVDLDYSFVNGDSFLDETFSLDTLLGNDIDDLPTYFQVTGIVYNVVAGLWASEGFNLGFQETVLHIGGVESNSVYSYSNYSYELSYEWLAESPDTMLYRQSVFSAGDSIHITARIDDYYEFVQGMEFEIEYEIEVTRIYGYNLTSYIQGEQQNAYESGFDEGEDRGLAQGYELGYNAGRVYGEQLGYDNGYQTGYEAGYSAGEGYGYNEGLDDGAEQGYNQGYTEGNLAGYQTGYQEGYSAGEGTGYNEGFDAGTEQGYTQGYDEGYDRGFIVGKNTGFNEGVEQAGDYTFFSLITSVFDAPLRVILGEWVDTNNDGVVDELTGGFLNFYVPVLDIDLAPFILSIFTVCIIIIVIRFVLARL